MHACVRYIRAHFLTLGLQVGSLLVLFDVISNISSRASSLLLNGMKIFTSGPMVMEVATLLNYQTRTQKGAGHPSSVGDNDAIDEAEAAAGLGGKEHSSSNALMISDVTFNRGKTAILSSFNLYKQPPAGTPLDPVPTNLERHPAVLSGGRLIHVRTTGEADPLVAGMLLRMLAGQFMPDSGVAKTLAPHQVELVSGIGTNELFRSTLHRNLTYAIGFDESRQVTDAQLWELCRRVGLSAGLLGETCVEGWAKIPFCPRLHDKAADLTKILLVRALLQDPTVLIAEQVADSTDWLAD